MVKAAGVTRAVRATNRAVVQKKAKNAKYTAARMKLNPVVAKLVDRRIAKANSAGKGDIWFIGNGGNISNFDGPISGTPDLLQLFPIIAQGDTQGSRQGDTIKLLSMTLYVTMRYSPDPTTNLSSPIVARMIVGESKRLRTWEELSVNAAQVLNVLVRNGDDALSYDGTYPRHCLPVNRGDIKVCKDKKITLVSSEPYIQNGGGTTSFALTLQERVKQFKIRIPVKNKVLKYAAIADQYPTNFAPFMLIGFWNMNQNTADTNTRLAVHWSTHVVFEP